MQDRFKFNAIVSSYYDIDTPDEYKEVEPKFYLKNVDVFCTQEIGIDYDVLLKNVKEQSKNLTEKEVGQIMQHFEDNSNSVDCEFVTITPDKIIQCTGLKDKNGKLIYEGDILKVFNSKMEKYEKGKVIMSSLGCWSLEIDNLSVPIFNFIEYHLSIVHDMNNIEVIGNIYENPELL